MGGVMGDDMITVYGNIIYGFTGTQDGMTTLQKVMLENVLRNCFTIGDEFFHGDCIGADAQAHDIASEIGYEVHIFPGAMRHKRAFKKGHVIYQAAPPLVRNKVIVDRCMRLIACPKGIETLRSGTWSTVRYARKKNKPIHIIYPDGKLVNENETL